MALVMIMLSTIIDISLHGAFAAAATTASPARSNDARCGAASGASRSTCARDSAITSPPSSATRFAIAPPTKPPAPITTVRVGNTGEARRCVSTVYFSCRLNGRHLTGGPIRSGTRLAECVVRKPRSEGLFAIEDLVWVDHDASLQRSRNLGRLDLPILQPRSQNKKCFGSAQRVERLDARLHVPVIDLARRYDRVVHAKLGRGHLGDRSQRR